MPPRIIVRDGPKRILHVDVTSWQQSIQKEVAKGLRVVERESRREGLVEAMRVVDRLIVREPKTDVQSFRNAALKDAIDALWQARKS